MRGGENYVASYEMVDKYTFRAEWSEEDKAHVARCLEFPSVMAHGKTPESALREIRKAVSQSIQWMEEGGEEIRAALLVLERPRLRFPNAGEHLIGFLKHPEVRELRGKT